MQAKSPAYLVADDYRSFANLKGKILSGMAGLRAQWPARWIETVLQGVNEAIGGQQVGKC